MADTAGGASSNDESIQLLMDLTAVSADVARKLLQITHNDVETACTLWFDNPDIINSLSDAPAASSSSAARPQPSSSNPPRLSRSSGRVDASGVIHIDSESDNDDADVDMAGAADEMGEAAAAVAAARFAQEDEDAAYARRLQEELYGAGGAGGGGGGGGGPGGATDDDVRAPIARTTETLVGGADYSGIFPAGARLNPDEDEDEAERFLQEMRRERQARNEYRADRGAGVFSQSVWDDGPPAAGNSSQDSNSRRLVELFRPPREILTHLDWDDTREEGKDQKKWILVNLQDMSVFQCQLLNRDIWKDERVQQLVRERFLFLQYDKDHTNARQYIQLYLPNEQHKIPENYPHISVVDPRTGEQMKVWAGVDCPTQAADFVEKLEDFLERYKFQGKNPVAQTRPPKKKVDVDRMTEDEMLQLAMQNSLEGANGESSESSTRPSIHDPDELTRVDKGKHKAADDPDAAIETLPPPPQEQSPFARIPSDRPHEEPAPGGAGITRIQFMHPGGRVVRRFATSDSVSRVYEWLKAAPLDESKAGVEFELKRMPQGVDLITDLDKTIEEAGIKQSTLAVEFLES
ncbi:hypothetical protein GGTG_09212 [Gaeumannomyces tritici R3-111a-1]|uniref:UBX domain-containing protein n=1 Tax=Gaeumannomyces tritici (strain R3-111a-1) TaxID=644352 RepID=J3P6S0_GAET3|nr:hypothetical protein GGTG_09212 [Gaeumannomyces tritici R3-111a-1]EJT72346.1 hypothetical protein GGTG_09212 [Gaeumannomyces tritici R3-111a-1]